MASQPVPDDTEEIHDQTGVSGSAHSAKSKVCIKTMPQRRVLIPPLNFAMVCPGVYRSGYPNSKNFPFLEQLNFKSIVYLCPQEYTDDMAAFINRHDVKVFSCGTKGNIEPFGRISETTMAIALKTVMNKENHPILIHCDKGHHRTGCVVGCLRRLQGWTLTATLEEYGRHTNMSFRPLDEQFIELFDVSKLRD